MSPWEEGQTWSCPHCGRECIINNNKPMDMVTHGIHRCEQYTKLVAAGIIIPKNRGKLSDFFKRYRPIKIRKKCTWCNAVWWWNEELPPEMQQFFCPNCEDENGLPNGWEHPTYGFIALVSHAIKAKKEIPDWIMKEYRARTTKKSNISTRRTTKSQKR